MTRRLLAALVALQCALTIMMLARSGSGDAQSAAPLLRARAIELVDEAGNPRAQIGIEAEGEVVLRLRDATGAVRVKLGASQAGSGLLLLNNSTEPGLQLLAQPSGTKLVLRAPDGRERTIEPKQ
jgi:hypothetical protein